jgi:photosystem II stability/assembly factor-like uncharacterized protein
MIAALTSPAASDIPVDIGWSHPTPQGARIESIVFGAGGGATAVTSQGGVLTSDDQGATWTVAHVFDGYPDVWALAALASGDLIVSLGADLLRSSDGGATWAAMASPGCVTDIVEISPGVLSATGCGIYRSTDDGATWTLIGSDEMVSLDQHWFSADTGVVISEVVLWRTTDGGDTWSETPATSFVFHTLDFAGDEGILCGIEEPLGSEEPLPTGVWTTTDGGVTWTIRDANSAGRAPLAVGGGRFLTVAHHDVIESLDGGATWSDVATAPASDARAFARSGSVLVCGGAGGYLFRSTDDGLTWADVTSPFARRQVMSVLSVVDGFGLAVTGRSGATSEGLRSADDGLTWMHFTPPITPVLAGAVRDASFGILSARNGAAARTTDGGVTWAVETILDEHGDDWEPREFDFSPTTDHVVALASGGIESGVLVSTLGSTTWERRDDGLPADATIKAIGFSPASVLHAVVLDGEMAPKVWRSADLGQSWSLAGSLPSTSPGIFGVSDMVWMSAEVGFVSAVSCWECERGVFRTEDGGVTWEEVVPEGAIDLAILPGGVIGVLIEPWEPSQIQLSVDQGDTWQVVALPIDRISAGITDPTYSGALRLSAASAGFLVGGTWSEIVRGEMEEVISTPGIAPPTPGVHLAVAGAVGTHFDLAYAVAGPQAGTLAIYDAAGREVRHLGDGLRSTGRVAWDGRANDGRAVASGVYVVRLRAGGTAESRRLVVVR